MKNKEYKLVVTDEIDSANKSYATASMILGIVAIVFLLIPHIFITVYDDLSWIALICAMVGLIHGIAALYHKTAGKNMAVAGVILNSVAILLFVLF
jgi:hypothetical protein